MKPSLGGSQTFLSFGSLTFTEITSKQNDANVWLVKYNLRSENVSGRLDFYFSQSFLMPYINILLII